LASGRSCRFPRFYRKSCAARRRKENGGAEFGSPLRVWCTHPEILPICHGKSIARVKRQRRKHSLHAMGRSCLDSRANGNSPDGIRLRVSRITSKAASPRLEHGGRLAGVCVSWRRPSPPPRAADKRLTEYRMASTLSDRTDHNIGLQDNPEIVDCF
jgi:hypothetical protein